ncbi:hypothetical protein BHM03_00042361 [Ensete ventricosum]|nr:hypothetical protein BHM03_00042361 [Ensete ventricosum]
MDTGDRAKRIRIQISAVTASLRSPLMGQRWYPTHLGLTSGVCERKEKVNNRRYKSAEVATWKPQRVHGLVPITLRVLIVLRTGNDLSGVRLVAGMRPGSMGGSQNFEEGADDAGTRRGHVHFDWKRSPRIRSTIITEKGNVILSAVSKEPKA